MKCGLRQLRHGHQSIVFLGSCRHRQCGSKSLLVARPSAPYFPVQLSGRMSLGKAQAEWHERPTRDGSFPMSPGCVGVGPRYARDKRVLILEA